VIILGALTNDDSFSLCTAYTESSDGQKGAYKKGNDDKREEQEGPRRQWGKRRKKEREKGRRLDPACMLPGH
jgi:hypothetical protein